MTYLFRVDFFSFFKLGLESVLGSSLYHYSSSQNEQKVVSCTESHSNFELWYPYREGIRVSRSPLGDYYETTRVLC